MKKVVFVSLMFFSIIVSAEIDSRQLVRDANLHVCNVIHENMRDHTKAIQTYQECTRTDYRGNCIRTDNYKSRVLSSRCQVSELNEAWMMIDGNFQATSERIPESHWDRTTTPLSDRKFSSKHDYRLMCVFHRGDLTNWSCNFDELSLINRTDGNYTHDTVLQARLKLIVTEALGSKI